MDAQGVEPRACTKKKVRHLLQFPLSSFARTTDLIHRIACVYRSQMPLFGMDTTAKFGPLPDRFSISFEEGFRALPWMTLRNGYGVPLEKVEVTFIFSRSGTGEIHSMRSKTIYIKGVKAAAAADWNNQITVEYKWIEEEAVDLNGGAFVMFLAIFVVSIFFLFDLCGLCDSGEDVADPYTAPSNYGTQASAADPLAVMGGSRPTGIPKYE